MFKSPRESSYSGDLSSHLDLQNIGVQACEAPFLRFFNGSFSLESPAASAFPSFFPKLVFSFLN